MKTKTIRRSRMQMLTPVAALLSLVGVQQPNKLCHKCVNWA